MPRLPWRSFLDSFDWRQGEHVSLIGPTDCGKSTLACAILPRRDYVVVCCSKPRCQPIEALCRAGWRRMVKWQPTGPKGVRRHERRVLWPKFERPEDAANQRRVFADALSAAFTEWGWCVYIDEARYFHELLRLTGLMKLLWQQGREINVSLVATTQRPAYMPLEMYDQATHLFFWNENDSVNLTRLQALGGKVDARLVRRTIVGLNDHEFAYLNTRDGTLIVSEVEKG